MTISHVCTIFALCNIWPQLISLEVFIWSGAFTKKLEWLNQTISLENWNRRIQGDSGRLLKGHLKATFSQKWWLRKIRVWVRLAERTLGPMRGLSIVLCSWHASCCIHMAWQDCMYFLLGCLPIWLPDISLQCPLLLCSCKHYWLSAHCKQTLFGQLPYWIFWQLICIYR